MSWLVGRMVEPVGSKMEGRGKEGDRRRGWKGVRKRGVCLVEAVSCLAIEGRLAVRISCRCLLSRSG